MESDRPELYINLITHRHKTHTHGNSLADGGQRSDTHTHIHTHTNSLADSGQRSDTHTHGNSLAYGGQRCDTHTHGNSLADDGQRSDTLAVQTHVFGKRLCQDELLVETGRQK